MLKKVLLSTFNLYKGGSLSIYLAIKHRLNIKGIILHEVTFNQEIVPPFFENPRLIKLRYPLLSFNKFYRLLIEHLFIPLYAFIFKIDIVMMMGNFPALFWFGRQSVYFHNLLYLAKPRSELRIGSEAWLFDVLIRLKHPRIYVQTSYVLDRITSRFPMLDIHVIGVPMCIDNTMLASTKLSRSEGSFSLLYPAHYYPHKNHELIFSAQSALLVRHVNVSLTFSMSDNIDCLIDLNVINLIGTLSNHEMQKAMIAADAIIFLSFEESLGLPLLEACALKKPLLAPNLAYVHAVTNGAYTFDPLSLKSFIEALDHLLDDMHQGVARIPTTTINTSPETFLTYLFE